MGMGLIKKRIPRTQQRWSMSKEEEGGEEGGSVFVRAMPGLLNG